MYWDSGRIRHDPRFVLLGRRRGDEDGISCYWTGSGIAVRLAVRELYAHITADWSDRTPWMAVLLDGAPVARFALMRGRSRYALLTGMDPAVSHEVALVRDTQPIEGEDRLTVTLDGLEGVEAEILEAPVRPAIEFIGDSLTTGEGLAGPEGAMEWQSVFLAGSYSYAQTVCRMLKARGEWVSQSGWGIVTDWEGDRRHTLYSIYDQVCGPVERGRVSYDFKAHPVDAVVINLGTNDAGALEKLPQDGRAARLQEIADGAAALIGAVRARRPDVPVLWVYGMCGAPLNETLENAVRSYGDARVRYLRLPACAPGEEGSRAHPGPLNHHAAAARIAEELMRMAPFDIDRLI